MPKQWVEIPDVDPGTVEVRYKNVRQSGNPPPAEDLYFFKRRVQDQGFMGILCRVDPETGHQAFFFCLKCSCSCSSAENLIDHLNGEKHNKEQTRKQLRKLKKKLAQESIESGVRESEIEEEADNTVDPFDSITDHLSVKNVTDGKSAGRGECDQDWPKMRQKEKVLLEALLCQSDLPECILVHGQHDTGKTTVLRKVLEASLHPHTFVFICIKCTFLWHWTISPEH